jgi:CDGSH-type Zn-finger protein
LQKQNINQKAQPKVLPLPNGPFYLFNNMESTIVENLQNSKGEKLSTVRRVDLCRCSASNNKPFCDDIHSTINFSSKNIIDETNTVKNKKKDYVGEKITIHDNRSICSHAVFCVENLPSIFRLAKRPWIDPSGGGTSSVEEIIETIRKCPSGALSYSIGGTEYNDINRDPMVTVSKNGPYVITRGIELIGDAQIADGVSKEHYTLCRCRASNNKPFCDGSHNKINFKDQ